MYSEVTRQLLESLERSGTKAEDQYYKLWCRAALAQTLSALFPLGKDTGA